MEDVMLDLETFGLKPGSVIRSIGAVFFDMNGNIGAEFYRNIDRQSCVERGLTMDAGTVKWWAEQESKAQEVLTVNPIPLMNVAREFDLWFCQNGGLRVWAQGASFDPVLWEAAVGTANVPWRFYNIRDTRTIYDLHRVDIPREGIHHNALDDAKHQARCIAATMLTYEASLRNPLC